MIKITSFIKKLFSYIDQSISISLFPTLKNRIIESMKTPISECISEDEVDW